MPATIGDIMGHFLSDVSTQKDDDDTNSIKQNEHKGHHLFASLLSNVRRMSFWCLLFYLTDDEDAYGIVDSLDVLGARCSKRR